MDKELIVVKGKVIEQEKGYHAGIGEDIGYEAGAKMAKRHFDENPEDVVAHFMGRNIIEQILQQPNCIGIRIFHGINDIGLRQLILVGVDETGKNILEYTSTDKEGRLTRNKGIVADKNKPCPPFCGGGTAEDDTSGWF